MGKFSEAKDLHPWYGIAESKLTVPNGCRTIGSAVSKTSYMMGSSIYINGICFFLNRFLYIKENSPIFRD